MTKDNLHTLLLQIATLDLMVRHNLSSKEAKLLMEFPDIRLGKPVSREEVPA